MIFHLFSSTAALKQPPDLSRKYPTGFREKRLPRDWSAAKNQSAHRTNQVYSRLLAWPGSNAIARQRKFRRNPSHIWIWKLVFTSSLQFLNSVYFEGAMYWVRFFVASIHGGRDRQEGRMGRTGFLRKIAFERLLKSRLASASNL